MSDFDYATRRVECWIGNDCEIVDTMLPADEAMERARDEWNLRKLSGQHVDRVCVRNERTGTVCDEISWWRT